MSLGLSAPCLAPAGRTPWAPTWTLGLKAPNCIFHPGTPNAGWPNKCLQRASVAVCFLLPELALLHTLALGMQGAGPTPLARGPWEVTGALGQITPAWHLALSDAVLQPPQPWA